MFSLVKCSFENYSYVTLILGNATREVGYITNYGQPNRPLETHVEVCHHTEDMCR